MLDLNEHIAIKGFGTSSNFSELEVASGYRLGSFGDRKMVKDEWLLKVIENPVESDYEGSEEGDQVSTQPNSNKSS